MDGSAMKDVAVILVGLNAREYVRGCLESFEKGEWRTCSREVIYVDNASTDGSADMVRQRFPDVRVVANPTNVGFCKAANQGARLANARHYYFINDDTLLIDDAIALTVEYADAHPEAGTVGSRLLYPDLSEQWSGRRFPTFSNAILGRRSFLSKVFPNSASVRSYLCKEELAAGVPFEVDWVSAAGQLIPKATFERVGGFAEDYYYWHEAVLCDRIRAAGKRVVLHPGSKIIHYEGKGSGARPYKSQRFHIIDFHRGALRCYCDHYKLGPLDPRRWIVAGALWTRAGLLLAISRVRATFA
jgi:GT2 family glycosyltransferase